MSKKVYSEYCTGCGICHSIENVEFKKSTKGFKYPNISTQSQESFCKMTCPVGSNALKKDQVCSLWGDYKELKMGYSSSNDIREKASSGGIITSLCIYLLEMGLVDAIIHTTADNNVPYKTITVISNTKEELLSRLGSRYCESNPLENIHKHVTKGTRYAFIGKPCDVVALSNYMENSGEFREEILYKFSFFCAGTPSTNANIRLLNALDVKVNECKSLNYRGNGWPGFTTVTTRTNQVKTMTYNESWMNILGRDIRKGCKFCYDSIGEKSDISCGDYWYLDSNNRPDFSEHKGRNCIFSWSENGSNILFDAAEKGYIVLSDDIDENTLSLAQPNHYSRRGTMLAKLLALRVFGKKAPEYDRHRIRVAAVQYGIKKQPRAFLGTAKRIVKKKL